MEIVKTEGIVVGETNYSESSKILRVLTKEYGLISVMSKGCRNIKSKLRGVSSKLVYANFQLHYKKDGISTLMGADTIDTLRNIVMDIEKISYVSYILDLTEQVYKHSYDNDIYDVLIDTIKKINDNYDCETLTCIYEIKLLDYLGIRPNIDECSICGNTKNILTISINDGGYICKNCYRNEKIYSPKTIQLIRMFSYIDLNKITKLDVKTETKKEISEFISEYYDKYSGLYLKSKSFLKNLKKLDS